MKLTVKQRKEQLRYRKAIVFCVAVLVICWMPFFAKYFGNTRNNPTEGTTSYLINRAFETSIRAVITNNEEILVKEEMPEKSLEKEVYYSEDDLEELAHIIYAEAGANKNSDKLLYCVGSVVLNRVNSNKYPNTIHDVIYQKGQYAPARKGFMSRKPTDRCYEIAKELLINGSVIPSDVLGQASYSIFKRYGTKLYYSENGDYIFYVK